MKNPFNSFRLKTKFILIMLTTVFFTLLAFLILGGQLENRLLKALEIHTNNLAQAFQVSLEELTTQGVSDQEQLRTLLATLARSGIKEVSIISPDKEVIASSDPNKPGSKVEFPDDIAGFISDTKEELSGKARHQRYLFLPLTTEGTDVGYVQLVLNLADFSKIIKASLYRRILITLTIFSLGALAAFVLASKYTRPINDLVKAANKVAGGNLCRVQETSRRDELGELSRAFNEMIEQLRRNRELERSLAEAERFSQIGQLASGVAHELRNPLNFINLSADHLKDYFGPSLAGQKEEYYALIARVKDEVSRLNQLTNSFLRLGKPIKLSLKPHSINEVLELWLSRVEAKAKSFGVEIRRELGRDLPLVKIDREEIETCFQNIFANSLDAFADPGVFTVASSARNGAVQVAFRDNGVGIELEELEKVFEPYFSTKKAGIGLGLAITKRIVEEHGGTISITSRKGEGTELLITLPLG